MRGIRLGFIGREEPAGYEVAVFFEELDFVGRKHKSWQLTVGSSQQEAHGVYGCLADGCGFVIILDIVNLNSSREL